MEFIITDSTASFFSYDARNSLGFKNFVLVLNRDITIGPFNVILKSKSVKQSRFFLSNKI